MVVEKQITNAFRRGDKEKFAEYLLVWKRLMRELFEEYTKQVELLKKDVAED